MKEQILETELSLQRPGWTQYNLHAYKDRIHTVNGRLIVDKDYFVKTNGLIKGK
jgi:hypothetical protein